MTRFLAFLRRLRRAENGSATIEFVLVFPFLVGLMLSSFELGMLLVRQVMLDRGVEMTVREIRIGTFVNVKPENLHEEVKRMICNRAAMIPKCMTEVQLEMRQSDLRAWTQLPAEPDCVDRGNRGGAVITFETGRGNELMLIRACALFDPFFPTSGLGFSWTKARGGHYGLVSSSAFVVEPPSER